jgi:YesN/AraC family two-component response regulator
MQTVLVIEDDLDTREIYLECLEAEGFEVISAENGEIGIWKACQVLPDLVVCDVVMPHSDGYAVLKALRHQPATAEIPFIFLTAKTTPADRQYGLELGADDYLQKPCNVGTLMSTIATWLKEEPPLKQIQSDQQATDQDCQLFPDCPQLASVFQFIEANYDQPIGLTDIAQAVGYSPAYLTDLVKRQTGQSVHTWLVARRMLAAQSLLIKTDLSVSEISRAIGYANECNFFRQFRQLYQITPKAWRSQNRN